MEDQKRNSNQDNSSRTPAGEEKITSAEGGDVPPKKKIFKKRIFIYGIAGIFLLVGGVCGGSYLSWIQVPFLSRTSKAEVVKPPSVGPMLKLPPLVINVNEEGGRHYIKTTLVLEVGQKEWEEEVQAKTSFLTDLVILTLSDKILEDLNKADFKENIKKELLAKINQSLEGKKVKQIYFDEFLFQ